MRREHDQAEALSVDPITVLNWEKGKTKPVIRSLPAIFAFLGYIPAAQSATVGERLLHFRNGTDGLSKPRPSTLASTRQRGAIGSGVN
jgi:transcriptional regulator with XRE-family HTH domain